ncbi:MAG: porin family protein [Janthinobacterium lividum]
MSDFLLGSVNHSPSRWCILLLGLGLTSEAAAQQRSPHVQLGLKFSLNLSTFIGERCTDAPLGWEGGGAFGLMATRSLSEHSALQLEALFSQKGMHERHFQHVYQDPTLSGSANTYHAALQYLDVPLLYTWGPGRQDHNGPFVALGPQVSFAYSKREYVHPTSEGPDGPNEETLDTNYWSLAPVTAGYVVGAGYRWATGKAAGARIELRYSGDFTQVYRVDYGAGSLCPGSSHQFRNGVIQVQVSGLFSSIFSRHESASPAPAPVPTTPRPPVWPPRPIIIPLPRPVTPPAPPRPAPRRREPQPPLPRRDRPAIPNPTAVP